MRRPLAALAVAALAAFSYTLVESSRRVPDPASAAFQRMAGGLGMGATAALYWDFSTFDPRLEPDCGCALWPVPGGQLYSPEHRMTVFDPPELLSTVVSPPRPVRDHP